MISFTVRGIDRAQDALEGFALLRVARASAGLLRTCLKPGTVQHDALDTDKRQWLEVAEAEA